MIILVNWVTNFRPPKFKKSSILTPYFQILGNTLGGPKYCYILTSTSSFSLHSPLMLSAGGNLTSENGTLLSGCQLKHNQTETVSQLPKTFLKIINSEELMLKLSSYSSRSLILLKLTWKLTGIYYKICEGELLVLVLNNISPSYIFLMLFYLSVYTTACKHLCNWHIYVSSSWF